jgi:hypothetical protein
VAYTTPRESSKVRVEPEDVPEVMGQHAAQP